MAHVTTKLLSCSLRRKYQNVICVEVKAIPNFKEMCPVKIENVTNFKLHIQILRTKVAYYVHHTNVIVLTFSPSITPYSDSSAVLGSHLTSGRSFTLL